jgi:hypothetical protein
MLPDRQIELHLVGEVPALREYGEAARGALGIPLHTQRDDQVGRERVVEVEGVAGRGGPAELRLVDLQGGVELTGGQLQIRPCEGRSFRPSIRCSSVR